MQSPPSLKRSRGTPTFVTPVRPNKRILLREIASTNSSSVVVPQRRLVIAPAAPEPRGWSEDELKALVEFILLNSKGNAWPTHHIKKVWDAAGSCIKMKVATAHQQSGI